jgi:hypothetical protein
VRLTQRGVTKRHSMQRLLCDLAHARDVYVRANVAAGLASLAAPSCDDVSSPLAWLDPSHGAPVRAAAARWAQALRATPGGIDEATQRALAECTADPDPMLAASCQLPAPTPPPSAQRLDLEAYANDAQTPLAERLVALRLPDASVFVGYTDPNGHLTLPAAASGALLLEDAADAALEP